MHVASTEHMEIKRRTTHVQTTKPRQRVYAVCDGARNKDASPKRVNSWKRWRTESRAPCTSGRSSTLVAESASRRVVVGASVRPHPGMVGHEHNLL